MTTRNAVAVWTLALLAAGGGLTLVLATNHPDAFTARSLLGIAVALVFVGAGLVASYRRPDSRIGTIMVVAGFPWFLMALTQANEPVVFSFGTAVNDLPWAGFAYLVLAYPSGRLEGRAAKVIVLATLAVVAVLRPLWSLFSDMREQHPNAPENAFLVASRPDVATALERSIQVAALLIIPAAIVVLARRWRAASRPLRRTLTPPFLAFVVTVALLAASVLLQVLEIAAADTVYWVSMAVLLTVPASFAVGLLRTRLARAGVGNLLLELGEVQRPGDLRDSLARALGDPSLEVAYWIPERETFVDAHGNPLPLPTSNGRRHVTTVERGGRRIAALVHDASLRDDPGLLEAVGAAAALALENERRLADLAQSEARLRALVDALPDLMFRVSRDGTYLDVQGPETDLVAPALDLIGRRIPDVLPPEPAESIMRCVERLQWGHVETVEYMLRIGSLNRHFEARVAPITDDEVVLIVRDISDRKRAETQLQRLQEELRARLEDLRHERDLVRDVVQAAPSFFCLVDGSGAIVRFNRALERASGRTDGDELHGRPFWELFVAPEERDDVRAALERACCTTGETPERENRWISATGEPFDVAWSVTRIVEERGEQRFLISGTDVTERKRQAEELRRSRARIVEAASTERRRLERNLHDGAQQRLVSISLFLRLAQGKATTDPDGAEALLGKAADELSLALEELRELARGIHPAILTDRGLEPALEALVTRSPVQATLAETPAERLPEPVEAAAYYVVAEALTNVAKYAQASEATIRVARRNGQAVVEVSDDGVGGADPTSGSGLRGLADRVEALDGRLVVRSAPGAGTTVRAEIPLLAAPSA